MQCPLIHPMETGWWQCRKSGKRRV